MKSLTACTLLLGVMCFAGLQGIAQPAADRDPEVIRLEAELERRTQVMYRNYRENPQLRAAVNEASMANMLTEVVIFDKARQLGLEATEAEIHNFLLPMLVRQGLVDYSCENVFKDRNIQTWIKGQEGMTLEDLRNSGKALVLWAKIATRDVEVSEEEILAYIKEHPGMAVVPARIRIALTRYVAPDGLSSRSILPSEVLAPGLALATRNTAGEMEQAVPESYEHLLLWLELEKVDELLRQTISRQKVGFRFGPLLLANGATVEGYIQDFSPEMDFSNSPAFWEMACIRLRLLKADQEELFNQMVESFLDGLPPSPALRGFWKKLWGGVKKGFSYITGGVGGLVGFVATGNPKVALMGAKYGYQLGNAIKGYFSSGSQSRINFPQVPAIPAQYLQGSNFSIPGSYRPPVNYAPPPQYYIPPPQNYYPAAYNPRPTAANPYGLPAQQHWAPQLFLPQPVGYFY